MAEPHDQTGWFLKWPHKEKPVWEAWEKVHARFGIAAQRGCEIETGLIMLISQMEQVLRQKLQLEGLLESLRKNGMLPLGPLIELFCKIYRVSDSDDLVVELRRRRAPETI